MLLGLDDVIAFSGRAQPGLLRRVVRRRVAAQDTQGPLAVIVHSPSTRVIR